MHFTVEPRQMSPGGARAVVMPPRLRRPPRPPPDSAARRCPGSGERACLKAVLEPIFEADFKPCSYGFRPNRRAQDAIAEIHHYGPSGHRWLLAGGNKGRFA